MKLHELELNEFRGIKSICLTPEGENIVIWGENGTGKSAIVDAIDFLLTGNILRLTGEGTGNIRLDEYGPHIDSSPEHSWVRGSFILPGELSVIEITRRMKSPKKYETNSTKKKINPYLDYARQGQHILTRGEILKYISCTPGDRNKRLQALLKMNDITKVRSTLVTLNNECESQFKIKKQNTERFKGDIKSFIKTDKFDESNILDFINSHRKKLGSEPISKLRSTTIQSKLISPQIVLKKETISPEIVENNVITVFDLVTDEKIESLVKSYNSLLKDIYEITDIKKFEIATNQLNFYTLGFSLIDSNSCPFCNLSYDSNELKSHITGKIQLADKHKKKLESLQKKSQYLLSEIYLLRGSISNLSQSIQELDLTEANEDLAKWIEQIDKIRIILESNFKNIKKKAPTKDEFKKLIIDKQSLAQLSSIKIKTSEISPTKPPELISWDLLTTFKVHLENYEKSKTELEKAELLMKRTRYLLIAFEKNKDAEINNLYKKINGRFSELYRTLHGKDEKDFDAYLKSDGAALDFRVAFYGRDKHPPNALHSEGHQDSMGICLWLALSEYITENQIQFKIMDDVVMSVDSGHRRSVANMLASQYLNTQLIITTHDQAWVKQLKTAGVVKSKNCYHFSNWSIESGPRFTNQEDTWDLVQKDLDYDMVSRAAGTLRRDSEYLFTEACRSLRAPVRLSSSSQWTLGEVLPPAVGEYKKLLKLAKVSANSRNLKERVKELADISDSLGTAYADTNAEQWGVNASLHYNEWANLTKEDFQPIVEAFKKLFIAFHCPNCHGLIKAIYYNNDPVSLSCNCGAIDYSLIEKGNSP